MWGQRQVALSNTGLASKLEADMQGLTDNAWSQLGKTIGKYIQDNATVIYGWDATSSGGSKDPQSSYTASAITGSISISQPSGNTPAAAMSSLSSSLTSMVLGFSIVAAAGFTVAPGSFVGSFVLTPSGKTTFKDAMLDLATQVVTQIKTFVNTAELTGSHDAFVGGTTSMSIN